MSKVRDAWLDNVKAVLITLVIIGHIISPVTKKSDFMLTIYQVIFFFHMPCFIMLSGYFSKRRINEKDYLSIIEKLLIPFFIYNFVSYLLYGFTGSLERYTEFNTDNNFIWLRPIYAFWYIYALIVYNSITIWVNAKKYSKIKSFLLIILIGIFVVFLEPIKYMQISKILAFYPFFYLGYCIDLNVNQIKNKKCKIIGIISFTIAVLVCINFHEYIPRQLYLMEQPYHKFCGENWFIIGITTRILMYFSAVCLSFSLLSLMTEKQTLFTSIGRYSIYGYVLHTYVVMILRIIDVKIFAFYTKVNTLEEYMILLFLSVLLSIVLVTPIIRKVFSPLVEPKINLKGFIKEMIK